MNQRSTTHTNSSPSTGKSVGQNKSAPRLFKFNKHTGQPVGKESSRNLAIIDQSRLKALKVSANAISSRFVNQNDLETTLGKNNQRSSHPLDNSPPPIIATVYTSEVDSATDGFSLVNSLSSAYRRHSQSLTKQIPVSETQPSINRQANSSLLAPAEALNVHYTQPPFPQPMTISERKRRQWEAEKAELAQLKQSYAKSSAQLGWWIDQSNTGGVSSDQHQQNGHGGGNPRNELAIESGLLSALTTNQEVVKTKQAELRSQWKAQLDEQLAQRQAWRERDRRGGQQMTHQSPPEGDGGDSRLGSRSDRLVAVDCDQSRPIQTNLPSPQSTYPVALSGESWPLLPTSDEVGGFNRTKGFVDQLRGGFDASQRADQLRLASEINSFNLQQIEAKRRQRKAEQDAVLWWEKYDHKVEEMAATAVEKKAGRVSSVQVRQTEHKNDDSPLTDKSSERWSNEVTTQSGSRSDNSVVYGQRYHQQPIQNTKPSNAGQHRLGTDNDPSVPARQRIIDRPDGNETRSPKSPTKVRSTSIAIQTLPLHNLAVQTDPVSFDRSNFNSTFNVDPPTNAQHTNKGTQRQNNKKVNSHQSGFHDRVKQTELLALRRRRERRGPKDDLGTVDRCRRGGQEPSRQLTSNQSTPRAYPSSSSVTGRSQSNSHRSLTTSLLKDDNDGDRYRQGASITRIPIPNTYCPVVHCLYHITNDGKINVAKKDMTGTTLSFLPPVFRQNRYSLSPSKLISDPTHVAFSTPSSSREKQVDWISSDPVNIVRTQDVLVGHTRHQYNEVVNASSNVTVTSSRLSNEEAPIRSRRSDPLADSSSMSGIAAYMTTSRHDDKDDGRANARLLQRLSDIRQVGFYKACRELSTHEHSTHEHSTQ